VLRRRNSESSAPKRAQAFPPGEIKKKSAGSVEEFEGKHGAVDVLKFKLWSSRIIL
jgi:hypothetical protein